MRVSHFLIALCLGVSGTSFGQQALGYRLEPGEVFTIRQRASQQWQSLDAGDTLLVTNRISALLEFRVLEVSGQGSTLELLFRDMILQVENNREGTLAAIHAQELDTTQVQSRVFNSLLHIPLRLELDPRGQIKKVSGAEALVSRMLQQSGLKDGPERTQLASELRAQFGSEALAVSYQQLTYFYPAAEVVPGMRWKTQANEDPDTRTQWVLERMEPTRWVLLGETPIRLRETSGTETIALDGSQHTRVKADPANGFPTDIRVEGMAEGFSQKGYGSASVPTQLKIRITYTLIDHRHVQ